jgi:hypothetical protein
MSAPLLLTFNLRSSSVKIDRFSISSNGAMRIGQGMIDVWHAPQSLHLFNGNTLVTLG